MTTFWTRTPDGRRRGARWWPSPGVAPVVTGGSVVWPVDGVGGHAVTGHHVGPPAVRRGGDGEVAEVRGPRDGKPDGRLGGVGGQLHRGDRVGAHHVAHRPGRRQRRSRGPGAATGVENQRTARERGQRPDQSQPPACAADGGGTGTRGRRGTSATRGHRPGSRAWPRLRNVRSPGHLRRRRRTRPHSTTTSPPPARRTGPADGPVSSKWSVACWPGELSQHPT